MKPKRAKFYAFALNEFRFRRVPFTKHATQVGAEKAAYGASGQKRFAGVRSGDRAPESDLTGQILCGLEALERWAKDCNYRIDWDEMVLIYEDPTDV